MAKFLSAHTRTFGASAEKIGRDRLAYHVRLRHPRRRVINRSHTSSCLGNNEMIAKHRQPLVQPERKSKITLLFGATDTAHNNTVALKAFLETKLKGHKSGC